jgi:hypothetical protein
LDEVSVVLSSLAGGLGRGNAPLEKDLALKLCSVFLKVFTFADDDFSCNKVKGQAVSKSLGL